VRTEWQPPPDLNGAERERALRRALAGDTRENVVQVPGGYQNVMEFRDLNAALPRVIPTHPDSAGIPIEIARFSGIVQPFQPPVAEVRNLAGKLRIENDSLHFSNVYAILPGSRVAAEGVYALHSGDLQLRMRGAPLSFPDMRWLYPPLPEQGGGAMLLTVERRTLATRIIADDMDVRVGEATIEGRLDVTTGDTLRLGDTDLTFARVHTSLLEDFFEGLDIPRTGHMTGRLAATGPPSALQLDADVEFADAAGPTSRVIAVGELGIQPDVRFRDLRLRFQPLHSELARAAIPQLPVTGMITGYANLTGAPDGMLQLDSDLTLRDERTGESRIRATGGVDQRGELRLQNLLVRADPVRTDLLREHVPQLPAGATLVGTMRVDGHPRRTLRVNGDMALHDPRTGTSRVAANGGIAFADGVRLNNLALRFHPLQAGLVREYVPQLPPGSTVEGVMRLDGDPARALALDGDLRLADPASGTSSFGATGGIAFNGEPRLDDMQLRLHEVQVELLRRELPDLPPGGTLAGRLTLDGRPSMMSVAGALTHVDARVGTSSVALDGGVALTGGLRFRELDLQLQPLQVPLIRAFAPDLPIGGTLTGQATLNGAPDSRIAVRGDVVHIERGNRSHLTGHADVATGPGGWAAVDVTLQPLALATAGAFVPAAGLHGVVTGRVQATGNLGDLRLAADLATADGGTIRADGTLDLAADQPGYDVSAHMSDFDVAAISWRAPAQTQLTGTLSAAGRGTDPATMRAQVAADLVDSEVDDVRADRVRVQARIADGLATVDSSVIRLDDAEAVLHGSFGLVAWQRGDLAYRVTVDSLHAFAAWMPAADTAIIAADTAVIAADTAVIAADTSVLAADTAAVRPSAPAAPAAVVAADVMLGADSALVHAVSDGRNVPRDSLAGRLRAAGTLRGNIHDFDVYGRADMEDVVFGGTQVGSGSAEYTLLGLQTDTPDVTVDGSFGSVVAAGMAFDTVDVQGRYRGSQFGEGHAVVSARQADGTEFAADAAFTLALDRNELRLADATLRFDTITWQTTQPAVIGWGAAGIEVEHLDLRSSAGGRIFADGTMPDQGTGELQVIAENVEIAQVMSLLQQETDMTGRLDIDAHITGSRLDPVMSGTARLTNAQVDATDAPDVNVAFSYAGRQLNADAQLVHENRVVAEAEARLPVELALAGVPRRLLPGDLVVDVRADSLPVEAFPVVTEQVENVRGRISGEFSVRGTVDAPLLAGNLDLAVASMRVVPLGVNFDEVNGSLTLEGSTITIDSLIARSGGPVRVDGTIEVASLTEPVFNLEVVTDGALLIDVERLRLRADADVSITGPLTSLVVRGDAHALDNVSMDIALTIDRDVWLRSPEANVEIYTPPEVGPLRITSDGARAGSTHRHHQHGPRRIRVHEPPLRPDARRRDVHRGRRELDPLIQVAAEHEVRLPGREAFEIRVVLGGTVSDLA
jgi:hypothetical protein